MYDIIDHVSGMNHVTISKSGDFVTYMTSNSNLVKCKSKLGINCGFTGDCPLAFSVMLLLNIASDVGFLLISA